MNYIIVCLFLSKKIKAMEINLELRSKIVYCSLNIENAINDLLLKYLLITDKTKTKNFGNKAGISFKNKIDLLYDIDVIDKEELNILELIMVIRNKFLHDIKYSSFTILLADFDSSVRNKFLNFLNENSNNEKEYEKGFENLYKKVVEIINEKTTKVNDLSNSKIEFLKFQATFLNLLFTESLDLSGDLKKVVDDIKDEVLKRQILDRIIQFEKKINYKDNVGKMNSYSGNDIVKTLLKN